MEKPKGGRCQKAPYTSKTMRVPEPLEGQVQEIIQRYLIWISESGSLDGKNPPSFIDKPVMGISEEGKEVLDRLKAGEKVGEKEIVKLINQAQPTVALNRKEGSEHFREWSKAKCGVEIDFVITNAHNPDRKNDKPAYYLAST